jgi:hypothetical protein
MNNIHFFNFFNHLLNAYNQTHKEINELIKDKTTYYNEDISKKETIIMNKYKNMNIISNDFFEKISAIENDIKQYLNENCKHEWIIDAIDIDPEYTTQVKYCDKCNMIQ